MNNSLWYSKAVYHWSIYAGTLTDPEKVLADFMQDISSRKPADVRENDNYIFISFKDPDYLFAYTLPVMYKTFVAEG